MHPQTNSLLSLLDTLKKRHRKFLSAFFFKNLLTSLAHYCVFLLCDTPEDFGYYFLVFSLIKIGQVFSLFGFNRLIIRKLPYYLNENNQTKVSQLIVFSITSTLIISSIIAIVGAIISIQYSSSYLSYSILFSIALLLVNLTYIFRATLRGLKYIAITTLPFDPIFELFSIIFALSFTTTAIYSIALSLQLALIFSLLILIFISLRLIIKSNKIKFRLLFLFNNMRWVIDAFFFMLSATQKIVFFYLNILLLSALYSPLAASQYAVAWLVYKISLVPMRASGTACNVLLSENKNNLAHTKRIIRYTVKFRMITSYLLFLVIGAVFLSSNYLLNHNDQLSILGLLCVFAFSLFFENINSLYYSLSNNIGNNKKTFVSLLIRNILKLLLSLLTIEYLGALGAALSYFIASFSVTIINYRYLLSFKSR